MTLATILFLLGILIILSKYNPFLGYKTPQRGPPQGPQVPTVPLLASDQSGASCPASLFSLSPNRQEGEMQEGGLQV